MKEDTPRPDHPPHKRRIMQNEEQILDRWLASWATDENLTPSERRRAQEERDRRKALRPEKRVGVVVGEEGMTPEQFAVVGELLTQAQPTEIHHPGVASRVHMACKALAPVVEHNTGRRDYFAGNAEVVRSSDYVIATPKNNRPDPRVMQSVWSAVRMARHRSVPVTVILPNGETRRKEIAGVN